MKNISFLKAWILGGALGASASSINKRDSAVGQGAGAPVCRSNATTLSLADPPYDNHFYSDCNVAAQAVITSPLPDSDLSIIGPRMIVAWPAGDSGVCAFFEPQNGINGSLSIELINSTVGNPLGPVFVESDQGLPFVGIQGVLRFNSSATLTVPILGSIRMIRDFTEGPSILYPEIQDALNISTDGKGGASLNRLWLDNTTSTHLDFSPWGNQTTTRVTVLEKTLHFEKGDYLFSARMNYPQLKQLNASTVLNEAAAELATDNPQQTSALAFLSYSEKLLAGAWRFLTYFGRDSMIAALLLEPVLSSGKGSAMEAVIGAALERVNRTDGSVCHEETIGDYATWTNAQKNVSSNAMGCDYKMIDTDYFPHILMQRYFLQNPVGRNRSAAFLNTPAGSTYEPNHNLTWGQLTFLSAQKVMRLARPFFEEQSKENLIHLKAGEPLGQWRDSTYGTGGGRIPFDVNAALMPAALRAIAALTRDGIYPQHKDWAVLADKYAKVWEDKTLQFFHVEVPHHEAQARVRNYTDTIDFAGPDHIDSINTNVSFHALALDGNNNLAKVEVMNTDDCFRHFLLNTTHDAQLTSFLNDSATNIRRTYPAGLMTGASMIVANPAFGDHPVYARNWTNGAYHGTVIWSWQLAMMAKGLERQLGRCEGSHRMFNHSDKPHAGLAHTPGNTMGARPAFCDDASVFNNVKTAYNTLWDSIEANSEQLSAEVWSWVYRDGEFKVTPLGGLTPPPGAGGATESNIRQLWSLGFLAVNRNEQYQS